MSIEMIFIWVRLKKETAWKITIKFDKRQKCVENIYGQLYVVCVNNNMVIFI